MGSILKFISNLKINFLGLKACITPTKDRGFCRVGYKNCSFKLLKSYIFVPKQENDNVGVKKIRTRSHRDSEDK